MRRIIAVRFDDQDSTELISYSQNEKLEVEQH